MSEYDEAAALCRLADDGCPNHSDTTAGMRPRWKCTDARHCHWLARFLRASKANRLLRRQARTDPLTGRLNRRAIEKVAMAELRRRDRYAGPLTLGLIDIDEFKSINRNFLQPGGDKALVGVAQALNTALRETDRLGRVGGDEFLILAPHTDETGAIVLAERILAEVKAADICYAGHVIRLTVSIGFAAVDAGVPASYEQMLHTAAEAMRQAKERGRGCYVVRSGSQ